MSNFLYSNLSNNSVTIIDTSSNVAKKIYLKKKKSIMHEVAGNTWYLKKLNKRHTNKDNFFRFSKKNLLLQTPLFDGYPEKFWEKQIGNQQLVNNVIQHYKDIWPNKYSLVPFHGDLTFGNIIFLKNLEARFIDWEKFKRSEEWGLDICFFLISAVTLPALNLKQSFIEKREINNLRIIWQSFFKTEKFTYLQNPLKKLKKIFQKDKKNFIFKIPKKMEDQITQVIKF